MATTDSALTDAYAAPTRECDIVMKGGVTSGVVYPLAACELARRYRFRSIGGTSAGAIAAAATAAAELGRHAPGGGFARLAKIPAWLGERSPRGPGSNLFHLFQPNQRTLPLHEILVAGLEAGGGKRLLMVGLGALSAFPGSALLGALPAIFLVGCAAASSGQWPLLVLEFLVGGALAAAGAVGLAVFSAARAAQALPESGYGICSGLSETPDGPPALTTWLTDELDALSGKAGSGPLRFGDLWGDGAERTIDLQMMTTNLSHGRPYRIPFDSNIFFWDPTELARLFPPRIVAAMRESPRRPSDDTEARRFTLMAPLLPLPAMRDLPVVVATRLSLSFPVLLSAVPLWAIDWSLAANQQAAREGTAPRAERCWFSDGGITSNFPVHFFDRPLPTRPTFGINLRAPHPDHPGDPVWRPHDNVSGLLESWTRFDTLGGFLGAVFDTMQCWRDNAQMRLPGYRDRVVHVALSGEEGGLNLNMPGPRVTALSNRGRAAGAELAAHFDLLNHRWVRYRVAMGEIEELLGHFREGYEETPETGQPPYAELIRRGDQAPPPSYRWERREQRDFAAAATDALADLERRWAASEESLGEGAPHPHPELRPSPRY